MVFRQITAKDLIGLKKYFVRDYGICDYTFGANFMWYDYFDSYFGTTSNDMLIIMSDNGKNFSYPIGAGDADVALNDVESYAKSTNKPLVLDRVPKVRLDEVAARYKECRVIKHDEYFDYVYDIDGLSELVGKKYHGVRNHINKLIREYPDIEFRLIEDKDIAAVKEFFGEYVASYDKGMRSFDHDNMATMRVLDSFGQLGMVGGAAFLGDKVLGFAIGEMGDSEDKMFFVHIEKCSRQVPSVSKLVVREFAKVAKSMGAKYINRAEDMGDPGIRYSKEQYNPCRLEYKYKILN